MTPFSKWKAIGYAIAIFAAGGVSGGALGIYQARQMAGQPHDRDIAMRMRNRLQARLQLTPEQMQKVNPIIDKMAADLRAVRMNALQQVGKVFDDSYVQIAAVLTPEQKVKLDQLRREHREAMRPGGGHWHENGGHFGGGIFGPSGSAPQPGAPPPRTDSQP